MVTTVLSSAARLSLAPARLAGRMAGSLLRELRGNGAADARPASSAARSKRTTRARAKGQPKRAATGTRAKGQPKRAATGTRAKAQPKRAATGTRAKAQPKRAATGARAKGQPKRAATGTRARGKAERRATGTRAKAQRRRATTATRTKAQGERGATGTRAKAQPARHKPVDDATLARKVESSLFQRGDVDKGKVDVSVAEGVVRLRGEVPTPDLINELEARAARVTEVRRVENLVHVHRTPGPSPETTALQPETGHSAARSEGGVDEAGAEAPAPASALRARNVAPSEIQGEGVVQPPAERPSAPTSPRPEPGEGDESADQDGPDAADLDQHPA
jgi:osmotically-inducible protein OsmY